MINDYDSEILFAKIHRLHEQYNLDENPLKKIEEAETQEQLSNHFTAEYGISAFGELLEDLETEDWDETYETLHNYTTE